MSNKTISINPSLFSVVGSKTKKNKEKKTKPTIVPLISPNVIKNKLLKRIKEHKQKETQILDSKKTLIDKGNNSSIQSSKLNNDDIVNFSDEFNDSLNYLESLSKKKNIESQKRRQQELIDKRKEDLNKMTVKNYHSINETTNQQIVNLDLPEELIEHNIPINNEPFNINFKNDTPYGILKGGKKPTYREWSKTQRNNIVTNPNASLFIHDRNIVSEKSDRENRLNLLKQKIKNKNDELKLDPLLSENLIKKPIEQSLSIEEIVKPKSFDQIEQQIEEQIKPIDPIVQPLPLQLQPNNNELVCGKIIATKHITKKTIKKKYTLGRSKIKKTVSVLIKDRGTRKKILSAQKDLKRKNINDVKTYLREHNLIKLGSAAPNDVLRKLYETAMLAGEITNSNPSILLHNFSKEDKEL
jgi:hypothetical protein